MKIFSIHDTAADYFLPLFLAKTDNQAKRMFIGSLGPSFQHRTDFTLFRIGDFDDDTGEITPQKPPQSVLSGLSIPEDMDPNPSLPLDPGLEALKGLKTHNSNGEPNP